MTGIRWTEEQYKAVVGRKKLVEAMKDFSIKPKSKMGNVKTVQDGQVFDSGQESRRYTELKLLEKAGEITNLRTQVKYKLIPKQDKPGGGYERPVTYTADFVYFKNGHEVVEDSKGHRTQQYVIRRKLMLWVHGIQVQEV